MNTHGCVNNYVHITAPYTQGCYKAASICVRTALPVPRGPGPAAFLNCPLLCLLEDKTALSQPDHCPAWRVACLALSSTCQFVLHEGGDGTENIRISEPV